MGKLSKDRRDIYYRKAKEDGYRARSAYKLLQLDAEFDIFKVEEGDGLRVVDLCAAPGSWSQVIAQKLRERRQQTASSGEEPSSLIVAVDLQEMAPLEGVITLQGDITSQETADTVLSHFCGKRAHVVVCDGAPDVTGMHDIDEYIQSQLLFAAVRMAALLLTPGGTFVAKIFRGELSGLQFAQLQVFFTDVFCCKPASSRVSSYEAFVVCRGFHYPPGFDPTLFISQAAFQETGNAPCSTQDLLSTVHDLNLSTVVPFIACGDLSGFDADTTYCLEENHLFLEPTQPPLNPPYKQAVAERRNQMRDGTS